MSKEETCDPPLLPKKEEMNDDGKEKEKRPKINTRKRMKL